MAAFTIGLSALGLYGVVSFAVTARRREIGIRLAVGAAPTHVVRLFLRQAAAMSGTGLCLGAIGGYAAAQVVRGSVLRVDAAHPPLIAAVGVLLAAVILSACYWPARLASRVDPVEVLRPE
jgi:ABC-type antimicrobial peptide transport system permease subunit